MAAAKKKAPRRKSSAKSSERVGVPQKHGGVLIPGAGGGRQPGAGRPPNEFKALCQRLASRDATVKRVASILRDATHPQFMPALKWATENGYGKPDQNLALQGKLDVTVRYADE